MIAWLISRGLSKLAAQAVLALAAFAMTAGGLGWAHHHIFHQGELAESARRDKKEAAEAVIAADKLAHINASIAKIQASIAASRASVAILKEAFDHEKTVSDDYHRRVLSGEQRLRVLIRPRPDHQAGSAGGGPAGKLDSLPDVEADLAPATAGAIDQLRIDYNNAVDRLNAAIVKYDALKAAVDAMPQ